MSTRCRPYAVWHSNFPCSTRIVPDSGNTQPNQEFSDTQSSSSDTYVYVLSGQVSRSALWFPLETALGSQAASWWPCSGALSHSLLYSDSRRRCIWFTLTENSSMKDVLPLPTMRRLTVTGKQFSSFQENSRRYHRSFRAFQGLC